MFAIRFVFGLLIFLLSINAFAQQQTDEDLKDKLQKEVKLLEQILTDAQNLRLPENRALVFARVGSAYWKIDEKLARQLFQNSVSELLTAQAEVENEKGNKQYFSNLIYGQSPRMEIVNFIATRDAEFALEVLAKTRPARIAQSFNNLTGENQTPAQQYAKNEIQVEQRLLTLAAEQNPQIAVKRVRDSLKKGVNYETLNLLNKIYAKDAETANRLAEEITQKFLETDFSKNYAEMELIGYFVTEFGREKSAEEKFVKVPAEMVRNLLLKMTDYWLGQKNTQLYGYWRCVALIEKIFPDRAVKLKQKLEKINNQYQNGEYEEYNKLIQSNATPDELIAQAEKFQTSYRNEIYRLAAEKYAQNGNIAQAEKILSTEMPEDVSEQYLSQFYTNLVYQLTSQGKFDEANAYANQIPDENQRINSLINLANQIFWRNQKENQKLAENVLAQARALIPDAPETQADMNNAINLAMAYATIEPKEAFPLIESLTPMLNELAQANFVMAKFRNYGGYRQGEMQITAGNYLGVYNVENVLRTLKKSDFDRALQFTSGFNRLETRISLQLQLIDENLINGSAIINLPISTRFNSKISF